MVTGTAVEVVMPQMGVSVSEGTITRWLKSEGDAVAADEPLLEISTDKVDTEVHAPLTGCSPGSSWEKARPSRSGPRSRRSSRPEARHRPRPRLLPRRQRRLRR